MILKIWQSCVCAIVVKVAPLVRVIHDITCVVLVARMTVHGTPPFAMVSSVAQSATAKVRVPPPISARASVGSNGFESRGCGRRLEW